MQSFNQYSALDWQVNVTPQEIHFRHPMMKRTSVLFEEITGVGLMKYRNGMTHIAIAYMEDNKKKAMYLLVDQNSEEGQKQIENLKTSYRNKYVGEGSFLQISKLLGINYMKVIAIFAIILAIFGIGLFYLSQS